jgi:Fe-Mn family superoxide dismutase
VSARLRRCDACCAAPRVAAATFRSSPSLAAYTDKLNAALTTLTGAQPALAALPLEALLQRLEEVADAGTRKALRNNAGGYVNHAHFWKWMAPPGAGGGGAPTGELADAIAASFGDVEKFKEAFGGAAALVFGSGWAWLVYDAASGKVEVASTPNQDNPAFAPGKHLLLGLDVWEHAYYLKYQNKRLAYIAAWWQVVNWPYVSELFAAAKTSK